MLQKQVSHNLFQCILPFWKNMIDKDNGGYYGLLDFDLQLDSYAPKGCILNSRILWFFSNVYLFTRDTELLSYADHAFTFLKAYCLDAKNGGIYWSMTYDGKVHDATKHTYNQAFAIYALSSYYEATGNKEALDIALALFHLIENKCRLKTGYGESYTIDFIPNTNDKLSENNIIADKTMNTLLHICEAYTELFRISKEASVRERLLWVVNEFLSSVYNPKLHRLEVFFDADMHSLIDLHSYGHDIEAVWLIDRALEVLGDNALSQILEPMLLDLIEQIYEVAYKEHSLLPEAENQIALTTRIWWVQCEAIVGFYHAYQKTGNLRYREAAKDIWQYVETHFIDQRPGSEWYSQLSEDGIPINSYPIVEPWKCPYHNGRMCLEILKRTARDPVNPHATPKAHSLLKYLHSVAGKQIITGQHTQTNPMEERTYIYEVTGYYPRLQGFELLSYSPNINYEDASEECLIEISENKHTVDTALSWAKATGGIVSLCFHWFSPIGGRDKSFYTQNTDFDPCQIFITGSKEHLAFYHDLDELSKQLKRFQDADIPVLFRPLHEAEGNWFWWGSKGADVAARLYQLIYDYYVTEKQLNNLLWVWSCPTREGYPGDEYVDVISWDIYTTPHAVTDYESQYKELIANTSCFKVAALTEVGVIPDVDMLIKSHVPWAYYMTWSKEFCLTEEYNTKAALRKMYASPYSIKLECE